VSKERGVLFANQEGWGGKKKDTPAEVGVRSLSWRRRSGRKNGEIHLRDRKISTIMKQTSERYKRNEDKASVETVPGKRKNPPRNLKLSE